MPHFELSPSSASLVQLRGQVATWATGIGVEPSFLGLVVTELAANGLKASPPGAVVLATVEREGDGVRVDVADHGPGLGPGPYPRSLDEVALPPDPSSVGGRGLYLARRFCRSLEVDRRDACTIVTARLGPENLTG
jgi:anti-sigma regulatory factor (Ser/Thr protein kinase)